MRKFKTPNGSIVDEDILRQEYGESFESYVTDGTFQLASDDLYVTPNGSEVDSVELISEYGQERFNELIEEGSFKKKSQGADGGGNTFQSELGDTNSLDPAAAEEFVEKDYFTGAFGAILKGIDIVQPLGIGDFVDDMGRSIEAGFQNGQLAENGNDLLTGGAAASYEDIKSFISNTEKGRSLGPSVEMQDYQKIYDEEKEKGLGAWGVIKGLILNPTVIPEVLASSFAAMVNEDSLAAGGTVLAGGTAIGAAVGGVGAVAGLGAAVPYAFAAAGTVLETGLTFGELLQEKLNEEGKDLTIENVQLILNDPEKLSELRFDSIARGLAIGTIDAITGRLGGKLAKPFLTKAGSAGRAAGKALKGKAIGTAAATETIGGSLGETAGIAATNIVGETGQEYDTSQIMLEGIAEGPGAIKDIFSVMVQKPNYKVNGRKATAEQIDVMLDGMSYKQLTAPNFKISIDNDFDGRADKLQDIILNGRTKEAVSAANPELNNTTLDAIVKLEREVATQEGKVLGTVTGKKKISDLKSKIVELQENQLEEEVVEEVVKTEQEILEQYNQLSPEEKISYLERAGEELASEAEGEGLMPKDYNISEEQTNIRAAALLDEDLNTKPRFRLDGLDSQDQKTSSITEEMNKKDKNEIEFEATGASRDYEVSPIEESNSTKSISQKVLDFIGVKTSSDLLKPIEFFNNIPMLVGMSDILASGIVKDSQGNDMDVDGGIMFNILGKNIKSAWAGVREKDAQTQFDNAVKLYKDNKVLFDKLWAEGKLPQGHVPMSIARMSDSAINSNEAIFRYINPTIKNASEKNQVKALDDLKDSLDKAKNGSQNSTVGKNKVAVAIKLQDFIEKNNIENLGQLTDLVIKQAKQRAQGNENTLTLDDRKFLFESIIYPVGAKKNNRNIIQSLGEGNPNFNSDAFYADNIYKAIGEPSMMKGAHGDIVAVVGIDVTDKGGVTEVSHNNYGFGPKGKAIALISKPKHGIDVFSTWRAKASRVFKKDVSGKFPTKDSAAQQVGGAFFNDSVFQSDSANTSQSNLDILIGKLKFAFPSVNVATSQVEFDAILDQPGVRTQESNGNTILGLTTDGKIFINPAFDSLATPIHEFGHIWIDYLRSKASGKKGTALLARGLELVEGTKALKTAIKKYGDNKLAREEALVELMATKGETIVNAAQQSKFKEWMNATFKYIQEKFTTSEDLFGTQERKALNEKFNKIRSEEIKNNNHDPIAFKERKKVAIDEAKNNIDKKISNLTLEEFIDTGLADLFKGKALSSKFDAKKESQGQVARKSIGDDINKIEGEIEELQFEIEDKQEEIAAEKSDTKDDIQKKKDEIAKVRKSKKSAAQKRDLIEELKEEIEQLKEDGLGNIEYNIEELKEVKRELKKKEKKLAKLKEKPTPKPAVPAAPKVEVVPEVEVESSKTQDEPTVVSTSDVDDIMSDIKTMVDRANRNGAPDAAKLKRLVARIDRYIINSEVYQELNDEQKKKMEAQGRAIAGVKEKAAPSRGRILSAIGDIENLSVIEKLQIATRIIKLAKTASKDLIEKIFTNEIKGIISPRQLKSILNRYGKMNLLNENSIRSFVDYMNRVIKDVNYDEQIRDVKRKLIGINKVNLKRKIGIASTIRPNLERIFSIKPEMIPETVFQQYLDLVEEFSGNSRVLNLTDINKSAALSEEVLAAMNIEYSQIGELKDRFFSYKNYNLTEDGGIDYAKTLKSMIKDESITEEEAEIMRKFKQLILSSESDASKSKEELAAEKKAEIKKKNESIARILKNKTLLSYSLPSMDERNVANSFKELYKNKDILEALSLVDLLQIEQLIDNINSGYLPHLVSIQNSKMNAILEGKVLSPALTQGKVPWVSMLYANIKNILNRGKRGAVLEAIRRNPLYYVDQVFGNYKGKPIFESLFGRAARAQQKYNAELNKVFALIEEAEQKVFRSFNKDGDLTLMSKFKQMVYLIQLEKDSNPNNSEVNNAAPFIRKTIEKIAEGKTSFSLNDAKLLSEILDNFTYKESKEIDMVNLKASFNKAELASIKTIQDINESLADKAVFTGAIIRGDAIKPRQDYVHLNVLADSRTEAENVPTRITEFNRSLNPSSKSKSLIERTGAVSALNFDVYASVSRGAKGVLMDYHLTEPIKTARRTIKQAAINLKGDKEFMSSEEREKINAVEAAFNEVVENLLVNAYTETSLGGAAFEWLKRNGYRAILASTTRWVAELSSNAAFVLITNPKSFIAGTKLGAKFLSSDIAVSAMEALGSNLITRIYPNGDMSGRMIDPNLMTTTQGVKGSRASSNKITNKLRQLWSKTGDPYQATVATISDTLISTPDKIVMRPMWFGAFTNSFEASTGQKPDFDKIAQKDEAYLNKFKEQLNKATLDADEKGVMTGGTTNPFMGILNGTSNANADVFTKAFNAFNTFMTTFLKYEYITARTGVVNLVGNGSLTKAKGAQLIAGSATRMVMYTMIAQLLGEALGGLAGEEEEEESKSLDKQLGQAIASSFSSLLLGRDFGNATKAIINMGVESFNKEYLEDLREGEYDVYKDGLSYQMVPESKDGRGTNLGEILMRMTAALGPAVKTLDFMLKKATESDKKTPEAIERRDDEIFARLPLELLGNAGFIPMYKDIRRLVLRDIYSGLRNAKKESAENKKTKADLLQGYDNQSDMKRYDPAMWYDTFGPGAPDFDSREQERLEDKNLRDERRRLKDLENNYIPPEPKAKKKKSGGLLGKKKKSGGLFGKKKKSGGLFSK